MKEARYNILNQEDYNKLVNNEPERVQANIAGGQYLNLKYLPLKQLEHIDIDKLQDLVRIIRGFIFASLEASQSGHPGGSTSKAEQLLALISSGVFSFDFLNPKSVCRDRVVWSAGHCTPLLYGALSLIYESLKKNGQDFDAKKINAVLSKDLLRFRHPDGPQGHVESYYPLADLSTGSSGHGICGAAGLAAVHSSCGLDDIRTWVIMGDAESEEGMSYEARNIINTLGLKNLVVTLDRNHFGIDGNTNEVISSPYLNHWLGLGWNLIEANGHDLLEMIYAYRQAYKGFKNGNPTVILAHGCKGKYYGTLEGTCESHGKPVGHDEYVTIMKKLKFNIPGQQDKVDKDLEVIVNSIGDELSGYLMELLDTAKNNLKSEKALIKKMKASLKGRSLVNVTDIKKPKKLPPELVFPVDKPLATRKATQAFFKWLMNESAFFYIGTGDLSKSILTAEAEQVHGLINRDNKLGRGIRFGIAEQNMAMLSSAMTQDILPGGYQASSVFSSYGVFTSMMANSVRMSLISNHVNPDAKGFFIMLAAHDGLETGEDGPTHHGLFWMSLYNAYPGIKVYKPLDANETIAMLFHAIAKGEPIALSVARPDTPIFDRTGDTPDAEQACNGAYVFKPYKENNKQKIVLAVCGGQIMANTLEVVPDLENNYDVKIIAVTSPELFQELEQNDPQKAEAIISDEERRSVIAIHNGWKGFLYPFLLPADHQARSLGVSGYLKSGPPTEVYELAKLTPQDIRQKIIKAVKI